MTSPTDPAVIEAAIRVAYGDLRSPRFDFVARAIAEAPFRDFPAFCASEGIGCEEDTDANSDLSFGFVLEGEGDVYVLRISMVGPYAVLLRTIDERRCEVVASIAATGPEWLAAIARYLDSRGLVLMSERALERSVDLDFDDDPERDGRAGVPTYRALFVDTDTMPWE